MTTEISEHSFIRFVDDILSHSQVMTNLSVFASSCCKNIATAHVNSRQVNNSGRLDIRQTNDWLKIVSRQL